MNKGGHEFIVRPCKQSDWESVREIYLQGLNTRNATFETQAKTWQQWDAATHKCCRLIAELTGDSAGDSAGDSDAKYVVGWAALSPISGRDVYRGVAEVSIYVSMYYSGKGIGRLLLSSLSHASEQAGFWTLQSSIFPSNKASEKLHLACGFRKLGVRKNIAQLDGKWRDTLILERRSKIVGVSRIP